MSALHGVGVLVTRPEQQAMELCRLLEAEGAGAFRFPAIEIKPADSIPALAARLGPPGDFDLIIFVSANAVRYGASLLGNQLDLTLAAIGPATARALDQAGHRASILPDQGFDSENLLLHPKLAHVAGRRVLLIKGSGGRELLERELSRRGAKVVAAEVYRRERASPSAANLSALEERFNAQTIHVISATSVEIAGNLLQLATPALRNGFAHAHWLVPSARVAGAVRELGIPAPLLHAASAENQDLVAALIRWRSKVSGA
jgi:uroporphyrinogen-III synthase